MGRDVLPVPLRTTSDNLDVLITQQGRFKVENSSREEQMMASGKYFSSSLTREAREVDGTPTYVIIKTNDKYAVLEDITIDVNYRNSGDGDVTIVVDFFAVDSNRSDITIVDGQYANVGVSLNLDFVNVLSNTEFSFDSTVTVNSGEPDFIVDYSQFYRDTSGNKEALTGVSGSFFDKARNIIMSPNKTYVVRTISRGDATGTIDTFARFSFTEQSTESDE